MVLNACGFITAADQHGCPYRPQASGIAGYRPPLPVRNRFMRCSRESPRTRMPPSYIWLFDISRIVDNSEKNIDIGILLAYL
jgi:hypothetical protein